MSLVPKTWCFLCCQSRPVSVSSWRHVLSSLTRHVCSAAQDLFCFAGQVAYWARRRGHGPFVGWLIPQERLSLSAHSMDQWIIIGQYSFVGRTNSRSLHEMLLHLIKIRDICFMGQAWSPRPARRVCLSKGGMSANIWKYAKSTWTYWKIN